MKIMVPVTKIVKVKGQPDAQANTQEQNSV